jgi:hypothetical protein
MHQECIEGIDGFGCALLNTEPSQANRIRKTSLLHSNNEHGDAGRGTGVKVSIIRHGGHDSNSCGKIQTNRASSIMT